MVAHGLKPLVQVELFDFDSGQASLDCPLIQALKRNGAEVSAFDFSLATPQRERLEACK